MYSCDCGLLLNSTLWIEGHSGVENGYQHGEKAIGNAAKGAAVTVPGFSEALVMLAAARIELRADTRPVIQRVSQTPVARLPHNDGAFLPALSCHRGYPGVGSKRVVISLSLLEDVFSDLYRQMVTIVINQKGVAQGRLSRAEEYAMFCFGRSAEVVAQEDDLLSPDRGQFG